MADMMCMPDIPARARNCSPWVVEHICVHTAVDVQATQDPYAPLAALRSARPHCKSLHRRRRFHTKHCQNRSPRPPISSSWAGASHALQTPPRQPKTSKRAASGKGIAMAQRSYKQWCRQVFTECADVLDGVAQHEVDAYLHVIQNSQQGLFHRRGPGYAGLRMYAKRYNHLGIDTVVVWPNLPSLPSPHRIPLLWARQWQYPGAACHRHQGQGAWRKGGANRRSPEGGGGDKIADLFVRLHRPQQAQPAG